MRNVVIGTAGHIDHGKTTLVKGLTGIDTDVLPEEKKRGITINIGFSYLETPKGFRIGIVDLPGHEKFIKNMVAGASGIEYVIMVIACDDGIMEQTIEHFNICKILGIKSGIIVLTKVDLSSEELIKKREDEIREYFKGTFLEDKPIYHYSKKRFELVENIRERIVKDVDELNRENNKKEKEFKLSIDRVFNVKGHGVVVTGTSQNGIVKQGDTLMLYPVEKKVKVKKIENHGKEVKELEEGNRCALNLSTIGLQDIKRGDILSKDFNLKKSLKFDCYMEVLKVVDRLKNNSELKINIGTREVIGKIRILDKKELKGGEGGYVQIKIRDELILDEGERGICRTLSPVKTVAGIYIINPISEEIKGDKIEYIENLKIKYNGDSDKKILLFFKERSGGLVLEDELIGKFGKFDGNEKIVEIFEKVYCLKSDIDNYKKKLMECFDNFYKVNSLKKYISKAEIKRRCFENINVKEYNVYLQYLERDNFLEIDGDKISLKGREIVLTKEQKLIKDKILKQYKEMGFNLIKISSLKLIPKEMEVFSYLVEKRLIIYLSEDLYIIAGYFKEAKKHLDIHLDRDSKVILREYKESLGISRRIALLLLEKFDQLGITKKIDDYRIRKG